MRDLLQEALDVLIEEEQVAESARPFDDIELCYDWVDERTVDDEEAFAYRSKRRALIERISAALRS